MNSLARLQHWLRKSLLEGLIVPSTDEFLSEFAPPHNRRLRWATGFRGSTGLAVILRERAALFLDGRYLSQGTSDSAGRAIEVRGATPAARRDWLKECLPSNVSLGFDPWCHSALDMAEWHSLSAELGFKLEVLSRDPIDLLWSDRPPAHRPPIVDYPERYAGDGAADKCAALAKYTASSNLAAFLVADPEDVSWLLNVRAASNALPSEVGEWPVVPSCTSRALVFPDGRVTWFVEEDRLTAEVCRRSQEGLTLTPPEALQRTLGDAARHGRVGADLRRTPYALSSICEQQTGVRNDNHVAFRRWSKHPHELAGARRAHVLDAVAVVRFMAWLTQAVKIRDVSEFEAAEALEAFRANSLEYSGPSMPLMSASGASGAQPHYVPPRKGSRRINDHPLYWMDSGGHYPGGTTDNTLALAIGQPESRHVLAHTLVLQGLIALTRARAPRGTLAYRLDALARLPLWQEGLDFGHNTGHGVGNNLNIHESPVIGREAGPKTAVPLEPGMIVTNEPAYYADGDFGVRIETHMVVVASQRPGFIEFETISRLPIDARLVDFQRLSQAELEWLTAYHRTVVSDLEPLLDVDTAAWLRNFIQPFLGAERANAYKP